MPVFISSSGVGRICIKRPLIVGQSVYKKHISSKRHLTKVHIKIKFDISLNYSTFLTVSATVTFPPSRTIGGPTYDLRAPKNHHAATKIVKPPQIKLA